MVSIFRKFRQKLLKNNKVASYLLYAIGEIVLVMIGILLALQVNNWNENRKLKRALNNTLKTISNDLKIDTTYASHIIKFYEDNQENSTKILNREITKDNYKECLKCLSLVTIYQPFATQSKGINHLRTINEDQITENDTLITDISKFYSLFNPLISKSNERMETIILKNFTDFEQFPWFVDMIQGTFNADAVQYFTESEDYRKRVASHSALAVGNHLALTKQYKLNAIKLLDGIERRLEENN